MLTNIDMGLIPLKGRCKSSILACTSSKDLLNRVDAPLLPHDNLCCPKEWHKSLGQGRHLLMQVVPLTRQQKQKRRQGMDEY